MDIDRALFRIICPDGQIRHSGYYSGIEAMHMAEWCCACKGVPDEHRIEQVMRPVLMCRHCKKSIVRVGYRMWWRIDDEAHGLRVRYCETELIGDEESGVARHEPVDPWGSSETVQRMIRLLSVFTNAHAMYEESDEALDDDLAEIIKVAETIRQQLLTKGTEL